MRQMNLRKIISNQEHTDSSEVLAKLNILQVRYQPYWNENYHSLFISATQKERITEL